MKKRPTRPDGTGLAPVLLLVLVFFASCKTLPLKKVLPEEALSRLGSGAAAYAVFETSSLETFVELFFPGAGKNRDLKQMIEKTDSAALAFYGSADPYFNLAAVGNYPVSKLKFSLFFSPEWKKIEAKKPYWRSKEGLSLAFDPSGTILLGNSVPWPDNNNAPALPQVFYRLPENSDLRIWFPDAGSLFSRLLGPRGNLVRLPLSEAFLSLRLKDTGENNARDANMVLMLLCAGEKEARALGTLIRVAGNLLPKENPKDPGTALAELILQTGFRIEENILVFKFEDLDIGNLLALYSR